MFVQVKCSFCDQAFDFDSASGILLADCPHCGKQNTVAAPAGPAKELNIVRDAPNLSGAKSCPACKAQIARDAVLCIQCGHNFKTGRKAGGGFAANKNRAALLGGGFVVLALGAAYWLWPEADVAPPFVPAPKTATAKPAAPARPEATATPAAPTNAPAETNAPAPPTKAELAAQKAEAERVAAAARAEAERAAFEAKKFEAEQNLRLQLDLREPLYGPNELVELRRKNGIVDKGTFSGFAGAGTNRVALVATPAGEIGVPLVALDNASRRRLDPDYREAFIRHVMSTRAPGAPAEAAGP